MCSDHFKSQDYDSDPRLIRKRLKSGVVPSIFQAKTSLQNENEAGFSGTVPIIDDTVSIQDNYSEVLNDISSLKNYNEYVNVQNKTEVTDLVHISIKQEYDNSEIKIEDPLNINSVHKGIKITNVRHVAKLLLKVDILKPTLYLFILNVNSVKSILKMQES